MQIFNRLIVMISEILDRELENIMYFEQSYQDMLQLLISLRQSVASQIRLIRETEEKPQNHASENLLEKQKEILDTLRLSLSSSEGAIAIFRSVMIEYKVVCALHNQYQFDESNSIVSNLARQLWSLSEAIRKHLRVSDWNF